MRDLKAQLFGSLPSGWDVARLKHVCSVSADYGANVPADEYNSDGLRFLRTTDINEDGTLDESADPVFVPSELVEEHLLKAGDLLLSRSGTVGLSYLVDNELEDRAAYAGYLVRFRPAPPRDPRFLHYFTQSRPFMQQIEALSTQTTISNFSGRRYADMLVPIAPAEMEAGVADFLDEKTAEIDKIVGDKTRLIERLVERRNAIVTSAVTGRMNLQGNQVHPVATSIAGDARLDRSSKSRLLQDKSVAAWVEDLPSGWDVAYLRRVLDQIDQGWSPQAKSRSASNDEWGVLKLSAIDHGRFRPSENKALPASAEAVPELEVVPGDLLVTRANTPELVGNACYVGNTRPRLMMSDLMYRLETRDEYLSKRFLCYYLISAAGRNEITPSARGSSRSMVKISQYRIGSWLVPVPPRRTQGAIADFLDEETTRIDGLVDDIRAQILRLQEYRTSLITAAVTGQIDVRASTPAVA